MVCKRCVASASVGFIVVCVQSTDSPLVCSSQSAVGPAFINADLHTGDYISCLNADITISLLAYLDPLSIWALHSTSHRWRQVLRVPSNEMLVLYSDEYIMRHLPRLQPPGYFGTPDAYDERYSDSDDSDTDEKFNFVPGKFRLETRNWSSRHLCLDGVTRQEIHSHENVQRAVDNKLLSLPLLTNGTDDLLMVPRLDMLVRFMLVRLRVARARDRGEISRTEINRSEWGKYQQELLKLRVPLELFGQQFWVSFALHVAHNRGNSFVGLDDWSEMDICGNHYPDCLYETDSNTAFRIREQREERRRVRDVERDLQERRDLHSRHYYSFNDGHSDDECDFTSSHDERYWLKYEEMGCDCWTGDGMVLMANGSRQRTDTLQTGDIV